MNTKFKVKIVAIAKDEGAYLSEWVFHHLYFGFDAIDIYINRTTDTSIEILKKINKKYPNVRYLNADWIDMCPPKVQTSMQGIIYAKSFSQEQEKKEFTHILFLDIDEFWTPVNFSDTIHDLLNTFPKHTTISFPWFNILGEESQFLYLSDQFYGYVTNQIKSIINIESTIKKIRLHISDFEHNKKYYGAFLPDGTNLIADEDFTQRINLKKCRVRQKIMIIHRFVRSEDEYISMLHRGRAAYAHLNKLKDNRNGFLRLDDVKGAIKLDFPNDHFSTYQLKRIEFMETIDIKEELESAQYFVQNRTEKVVNILEKMDKKELVNFKKVFRGVKNQKIRNIIKD